VNPFLHRRRNPTLVYAVAIFLSSSLLFLIEPIAGKRLIPLLGGSAAVWTACLVFFQCALLLGYLLAHWFVTRTGARTQAAAYIALLLASLAQLTLAVDPDLRANTRHPVTSVLWLLTLLIGVPFVTLSATGPLLQSWYARFRHAQMRDEGTTATPQPYRLFAVSNVGSMLALVVYPSLIEPRSSLHEQTATLAVGFALFGIVCASIALSMRHVAQLPSEAPPADGAAPSDRPDDTRTDRILWISLAATGSILLSAVTNHISQNIATIPLLWIAPLVAYLLSFVVAFGDERWHPRWVVGVLAAGGLGAAGYLLYKGILSTPLVRAIPVFCAALFVLCLFCHSELYRRRPSLRRITAFYFYVAAGGALGAILVGVVAPSVLPGNYELAFGLACVAVLGLAVTWSKGWYTRGFWFVASGAMITLIADQVHADRLNVLRRVRNFYGTLYVTNVSDSGAGAVVRTLYHGVITHGRQIFRQDLNGIPGTYYGHNSGVGLALDHCCANRPRRVGVIGLGTGTLAAFGQRGDVFRFYDINPAVESIARRYFTYLRGSQAQIEVVNGDARVSLAHEPPQHYDVIAVDAFSGDAIPVHLITEQALALYRRHLTPNGVVAFHISNRYLNLGPVVEQLARNAGMKTAFVSSGDETAQDVWTSDWMLVTTDTSLLANTEIVAASDSVSVPPRLRRWTDDYNSLLPILRLRANTSP
jgi:SAM-dependent methyltransferase